MKVVEHLGNDPSGPCCRHQGYSLIRLLSGLMLRDLDLERRNLSLSDRFLISTAGSLLSEVLKLTMSQLGSFVRDRTALLLQSHPFRLLRPPKLAVSNFY